MEGAVEGDQGAWSRGWRMKVGSERSRITFLGWSREMVEVELVIEGFTIEAELAGDFNDGGLGGGGGGEGVVWHGGNPLKRTQVLG